MIRVVTVEILLTEKSAKAIKKSMSNLFEVEITTTLGCPVRCSYCPQDQLLDTRGDRKRVLSYEDFVRAMDNIDFNVVWLGQVTQSHVLPIWERC